MNEPLLLPEPKDLYTLVDLFHLPENVTGTIKFPFWKTYASKVHGKFMLPKTYQSHLQAARSGMTLIVQTTANPKGLIGAVRSEIWAVDKEIPVYDIKTMKEVLYASVARERFTVLLLTIFASVALILSAAGIYSVMSYSVAQRTHEIGIRMALGAQMKDVLKLVVRQAMILAMIGVAVGLAGAFTLTRLISSLLYDVSVTDPVTFGLISLLLVSVALVACLIPARRATRVDPVIALRYE